jgi:hypothetical protein
LLATAAQQLATMLMGTFLVALLSYYYYWLHNYIITGCAYCTIIFFYCRALRVASNDIMQQPWHHPLAGGGNLLVQNVSAE